MSSTAAQLAANIANAQHSTGPRTNAGKAASSKNAIKSGLFSAHDFVRPGEEGDYEELEQSLLADLVPANQLEISLFDEIRRALWRLRRCGIVEANMLQTCLDNACLDDASLDNAGPPGLVPDPMQIEAAAKLQLSVDRARSQCHRLLHKCTAELRKLQTERQIRNEANDEGTDLSHLGLSETRVVLKTVHEMLASGLTQNKLTVSNGEIVAARVRSEVMALPEGALESMAALRESLTNQTQTNQTSESGPTARNASCPCNSGQKFKRCCGKDAAPLLHAA